MVAGKEEQEKKIGEVEEICSERLSVCKSLSPYPQRDPEPFIPRTPEFPLSLRGP